MAPDLLSIIHGPSAPVPVSETFGRLLARHVRERGTHPAIISHHQNVVLTYKALDERSDALAASFHEYGLRHGDMVAIMLGSRTEYIEAFFACAKLGAALVLLNYGFTLDEIIGTLTSVAPKLILTVAGLARYDYRPLLPHLTREVPSLKAVVVLDATDQILSLGPGLISYATLLKGGFSRRSQLPRIDVSPHDLVNIQFTSGSTGTPKAAALSHYNVMNCGRYISKQMSIVAEDRICLPVPLFHSFGLIIGLCTSVWAGSTLVFPSDLFNAKAAVECIGRYKCTGIYGVTTMFIEEMNSPNFSAVDRSSLKFGIMAGSAMPPDLLERVTKSFPVPHLYTNWGMTELSSIVTMTHHTDPMRKKVHTAGRLFPDFTGKIVEPNTGRVLPWGHKGEIVISGYGVMRGGYLNNPVKTAETLKQHQEDLQPGGVGPVDADGKLRTWLHTGDEGYLDVDGYFVITGRIKDLIIRGGENISPVEIEDRLFAHPAIVQASVIGVPSARLGEEVAAFVQLSDGHAVPSDEELREWVRAKLSRFKTPKYFWWIGGPDGRVPREWPKTPSGKLRKPDLRIVGNRLIASNPQQPQVSRQARL